MMFIKLKKKCKIKFAYSKSLIHESCLLYFERYYLKIVKKTNMQNFLVVTAVNCVKQISVGTFEINFSFVGKTGRVERFSNNP